MYVHTLHLVFPTLRGSKQGAFDISGNPWCDIMVQVANDDAAYCRAATIVDRQTT